MDQTAMAATEFERETYRIDQLVWDSIALRAGETALFCGFANNVSWIKRAVAIGVEVSVLSNESVSPPELERVQLTIVRGSTSMLPARDNAYDVTIAFHYLHEVDPFFHANIVAELGRTGKRCVIVEPAPPSDPLGLRIAALYSRAKRELGQFENYHAIEYWRKLLAIVKPELQYRTIPFMRTPPREAMRETVALIIDTMAAEETPEAYLAELRALARRPDAQLLPQARFVLVGTAVGQSMPVGAGTSFRTDVPEYLRPHATSGSRFTDSLEHATISTAAPKRQTVYSQHNAQAEFPVVPAPLATPASPVGPGRETTTGPSQIARNAFGLPGREEPASRHAVAPSVRGEEPSSFGLPDDPAEAAAEFGWEWETPNNS